ncbi:MAG: DUF4270 family protein [Alistipes sp.]|nr:DUF4270 family protein [Alistipes sp.]
MMSCREFWSYAVMLLIAAHLFVGCTTEVDFTLGEEYTPTDQNMVLKRRVYRQGEMTEGDKKMAIPMASTFLYHNDSISSSNLDDVYFGSENSDVYGKRRASFMSQMLFGSKLDEEYGWGYRPIFDSMTLSLYVTDYHGDTTKSQRFAIYEIISNDYIPTEGDTLFYTKFDPSSYVAKEPIFEFIYPDQANGVYVGNMENPKFCNVPLVETAATKDYINRLMFTTNIAESDGYARDTAKIYEQGNEAEFVKYIRGVYIAPVGEPEGEGAMFATNVENTALVLYARSRYVEDPKIIKDTIIMSYNFFVSPTTYDVKAGNLSITSVEHEFTADDQQALESPKQQVLIGKVDAMAGLVTELRFTDEFIQSLADLALENGANAEVSVNQAHLNIYLEGSDYNYENVVPGEITSILDSSMLRMGLYARYGGWEANYGDVVAITDYLYTKESSSSIPYDGYLNRSLARYQMNISNHIQSLIKLAVENVDESGKVNCDAEALKRYRTIYIGPAADALFGFQRQTIYGGDLALDGAMSKAPISLELVYTVVN